VEGFGTWVANVRCDWRSEAESGVGVEYLFMNDGKTVHCEERWKPVLAGNLNLN
jgi:hypothetical protein